MEQYRSKKLLPGMLNIPGTAHVHIDGSQNEQLILDIVKRLEKTGHLGKINVVHEFIAGSQRALLPEVYQSHTPAIDEKEALDFFSSNIVKDRRDAIATINIINEMLAGATGVIVEMEQVIGLFDGKNWKSITPDKHIASILETEVSIAPSPTLEFEIHHGFNLPKVKGEGYPISLSELLAYCEAGGCEIGGWFVFEKPDSWAYRSNSFSDISRKKGDFQERIIDIVERENAMVASFLKDQGLSVAPRTLLEKVVGIWHK